MKKIQDSSASSTRPAVTASGTVGWFRHANALTKIKATKVTVDWLNDLQGSFMDLFTRTGITATGGEAGDRNLYDAIMALVSPKIDKTAGDARYVRKSGDTMTGLLTLSGDPGANLQAATKQYADTKFAKAGGTVTGAATIQGVLTLDADASFSNAVKTLTLSKHPTSAMHAATKAYVDNALSSGARLLFAMSTAPTGWTQDATDKANNRMLRVVTTTGNGTAGTDSPILNDKVPSHTHTFTTGNNSVGHTHGVNLTAASNGAHTHTYNGPWLGNFSGSNAGVGGTLLQNTGSAGAHTHSVSGNTDGESVSHTHSGTTAANPLAANWKPRYLDLILCTKD